MMTRKHFQALAEAISESRPFVAKQSTKLQRAQYAVWHETRGQIMSALQHDNPRFDRDRFMDATEQE